MSPDDKIDAAISEAMSQLTRNDGLYLAGAMMSILGMVLGLSLLPWFWVKLSIALGWIALGYVLRRMSRT